MKKCSPYTLKKKLSATVAVSEINAKPIERTKVVKRNSVWKALVIVSVLDSHQAHQASHVSHKPAQSALVPTRLGHLFPFVLPGQITVKLSAQCARVDNCRGADELLDISKLLALQVMIIRVAVSHATGKRHSDKQRRIIF
jgi:hypothetical protein